MQLTKGTRRWLIQGAVLAWAVACGREEDPDKTLPGGDGDGDVNAVGGALMGSGGIDDDQSVEPAGGAPPAPPARPCEHLQVTWDPPCSEEDIVAYGGAYCGFGVIGEQKFGLPLDDLVLPSEELRLLWTDGSVDAPGQGGQGGALNLSDYEELSVELIPEGAGVVTQGGKRFVVESPGAILISSFYLDWRRSGFLQEYLFYVSIVKEEEIIRTRRVFLIVNEQFCIVK